MSVVIDGTSGVTTPGVVNTAGETIATTLAVTGASTFTTLSASGTVSVTQATGNNFDASAVLAKNVLTLGSSGSNYGFVSNVSSDKWSLSYGATKTTLGTSALDWTTTGVSIAGNLLFNSGYGSAATAYGCRAWVNFNGTASGTFAGGASTVTRIAASTTATITTATAHGLITGNTVYALTGVVAGAYTVTVLTTTTFTITTVATTVLTAASITFAVNSIRASGNVSSITDNATGDYTVNFTTAIVDANYCPQITGDSSGARQNAFGRIANLAAVPTVSALRVIFCDDQSTLVDTAYAQVAIFR